MAKSELVFGKLGRSVDTSDICAVRWYYANTGYTYLETINNNQSTYQEVAYRSTFSVDTGAFTFSGTSNSQYDLTCKTDCIAINVTTGTYVQHSAGEQVSNQQIVSFTNNQTVKILGIAKD